VSITFSDSSLRKVSSGVIDEFVKDLIRCSEFLDVEVPVFLNRKPMNFRFAYGEFVRFQNSLVRKDKAFGFTRTSTKDLRGKTLNSYLVEFVFSMDSIHWATVRRLCLENSRVESDEIA
jgi:hypothetical protein